MGYASGNVQRIARVKHTFVRRLAKSRLWNTVSIRASCLNLNLFVQSPGLSALKLNNYYIVAIEVNVESLLPRRR